MPTFNRLLPASFDFLSRKSPYPMTGRSYFKEFSGTGFKNGLLPRFIPLSKSILLKIGAK
jgi:hypothetical protein